MAGSQISRPPLPPMLAILAAAAGPMTQDRDWLPSLNDAGVCRHAAFTSVREDLTYHGPTLNLINSSASSSDATCGAALSLSIILEAQS